MAGGNRDGNRQLRAVGVVRVSQKAGREGDAFRSPPDQEAAIRATCDEQGWRLVEIKPHEINVSGSWPLTRRPGLLAAVEDVEAGRAEIVIGDAADRLTWNPGVRDEVIERVEAVGGFVWAAANGLQSNEDPARQFSGTVITAADRYSRRMNAAKARRAVVKAVEEGVLPWPNVTPGYLLGPDRRLVPDPKTRDVVAEAFRMRARGASVREVREYLARHGIRRAHSKVRALLSSRVVLGEIHFGKLLNQTAHKAIVDRETWKRAQRASAPRGRQAKSERLLARLGVLRCATCDARMVVGSAHNSQYALYRCPPNQDCPRRVTISAPLVESVIVDAVKAATADVEGRASAEGRVREVERDLERAQTALDRAVRAFTVLGEDEPAAIETLAQLRDGRDRLRDELDELGGTAAASAVTVTAARDWDRLTVDERRALVRAVVARATVGPGRGADRIRVELIGQ